MLHFGFVLASLEQTSPHLWLVLFAIPATCITFLQFRKDGIIKMPFTQHVLGTCVAYGFFIACIPQFCTDEYDFKDMLACSIGIGFFLPYIGYLLGHVFFLYFPKRNNEGSKS